MTTALIVIPNNQLNGAPRATGSVAAAQLVKCKDGPGVVYGVAGRNTGGADEFIQLHDKKLTPVNGDAPMHPAIKATAGGNYSQDYGTHGLGFANALWLCVSTTEFTLTLGATDCTLGARIP